MALDDDKAHAAGLGQCRGSGTSSLHRRTCTGIPTTSTPPASDRRSSAQAANCPQMASRVIGSAIASAGGVSPADGMTGIGGGASANSAGQGGGRARGSLRDSSR
jgi:hypothetical protein